jgi:hypothetical protein
MMKEAHHRPSARDMLHDKYLSNAEKEYEQFIFE